MRIAHPRPAVIDDWSTQRPNINMSTVEAVGCGRSPGEPPAKEHWELRPIISPQIVYLSGSTRVRTLHALSMSRQLVARTN